MISTAFFMTYTIMCFLGLQAITLILLITKHNDTGTTPLLRAGRNFTITTVVLGLFYYYSYYRELVLNQFDTPFILRGLDAVIFYILGFTWVQLIDSIAQSSNPKLIGWKTHIKKIFGILMLISAGLYIFLLDSYYTTDYFWAEILVVAFEAILGIVVMVYTIAYIYLSRSELANNKSYPYIILVSIFVCFTTLWNNCVVISVYLNGPTQVMNAANLYAVTSILLLAANLLTLLYFYRKDFSPVYFGTQKTTSHHLSEDEVLDLIAQQHRLTEREREVMLLAYHGMSNPDIAEELYISRHTVKRHMHNIFEKLEVSTRMELIHLVQAEEHASKK